MSRHRIGLLVLALTAAPAAGLLPQEPAGRRLRRQADSLAREWRQANGFATMVDSVERSRAGALDDTVGVGALRIITNRSPLPVREAAARAWPMIDSVYGDESQAFAQRPYVILAVDPDTSVRRARTYVGLQVDWNLEVEALARLLLATAPTGQPDGRLHDWLAGPVRPVQNPDRVRGAVYVALVTGRHAVSRHCLLGDIRACYHALALGDRSRALDDWYVDPSERHWLVTSMFAGFFDRGGTAGAYQSCARGGDSSCSALLRTLPLSAVPRPLGPEAQRSLVDLALRMGGRNSYHRLVSDSTASIAARLAAASGVPIDSLLSSWHAEILAARPLSVPLSAGAVGATLLWVVIFGLCGLGSSRWRLQ